MKVLVFPRDENPYQGSLYGAMDERDVEVYYLDGPTSSQTVNLLALPFLLLWYRARGVRLLHVHWVHPFLVTWARRDDVRGLVQRAFELFLAFASALGYRIVWTAHNVVPHLPVFRDDVAARRTLVARSDAVIAHSRHTAAEVAAWGAQRVVVIPQGADGLTVTVQPDRDAARRKLGLDPARPTVVFFGNVLPYKGVDLLIDAAAELPPAVTLDVVVVGRCRDEHLLDDLETRAHRAGSRVRTRFDFVTDVELAGYLAAADLAVFPFRTVTNSSSVATALGAGVPVVVPRLAVLDDLPDGATVRYDPGPDGLISALTVAAGLDDATRQRMRAAASRFAETRTWAAAAAATRRLYADVLRGSVPDPTGCSHPSLESTTPMAVR